MGKKGEPSLTRDEIPRSARRSKENRPFPSGRGLTPPRSDLGCAALTSEPASAGTMRLDKWLWAVRVHRSRALATDACRAGSVFVNDLVAKPAREVRPGEIVRVRIGLINRTLRVIGAPRSRVGAKLVGDYCADLTPPEEMAKLRENTVQQVLAREKGSGRPTKRDRRLLDELFG